MTDVEKYEIVYPPIRKSVHGRIVWYVRIPLRQDVLMSYMHFVTEGFPCFVGYYEQEDESAMFNSDHKPPTTSCMINLSDMSFLMCMLFVFALRSH